MEDIDAQTVSHGLALRPMATPGRGPAAQRGSLATQGRPSNSTPTPRTKSDVPARPPSAGISAWEDDSPNSAADLLEYLGKADSVDSGTSTPPQPGPITGDGNLTQALLLARKAAEAGASGGGDAALSRTASSLKSQSSGGSYAGGTSSRTDAKGRQQPGRLSRGSTSTGNEPPPSAPEGGGDGQARAAAEAAAGGQEQETAEQQQPFETPRTVLGTPRTEAMETTRDGADAPDGSQQAASWSEAPGGAGGGADAAAAGGGSEAERLRGLLYSDDEGDDEDYQDLMTADDDALFGGVGRGNSGGGGAAAGGKSGGSAAGRSAGGAGSRSLARTDASSVSGTIRSSGDGDGGESVVDVPTGAGSSHVTTTSGAAGAEPAAVGGEAAAPGGVTGGVAGGGGEEVLVSSSTTGGILSPALSHSSREGSLPASPSWNVAKGDGVAAFTSTPRGPGGSFRIGGGGAATEALEKVLSGRVSLAGSRQQHPQQLAPQDTAGAAEPSSSPTASPMGQWQALGPSSQQPSHVLEQQGGHLQQQQHLQNQHHHQQHQQLQQLLLHQQQQHYPQHRSSIPTPQLGEGLRQHPPQARRLYTPGQTNRSPIRGSGYVVSPAAVRSTSPSVSPGRGAFSAVHHPHPSVHHHAAISRRLSSPSVTLGIPATMRPRSPRESHTSAFSGPAFTPPDGSDEAAAVSGNGGALLYGHGAAAAAAGGGGGPPGLNGGVLKMGSWVTGAGGSAAAAGSAAAGGGHGLALGHSTVSRFPPAHVQTFAGGQVYRSTPISQVPGSASDEVVARGLEGVGGGGPGQGAGGGGGGGGGTLGPAGVARSSGSPGRLSSRGGRQSRAAAPSSPVGPAGPSAAAATAGSGYASDRFGSYSAPARPSTSPHKACATAGVRSSVLAGAGAAGGGGLPPAAATAIFGGGIISAPAADAVDTQTAAAMAAAPLPRGVGVPALPSYTISLGIRHTGFKQAPPPGGSGSGGSGPAMYGAAAAAGSGAFGSPFSTGRQKVGGGGVTPDERMRSLTLAKIFGGVGVVAKEGHASAQQDYSVLHMPSPRSGADGGGGFFPVAADGLTYDAAVTAAAEYSMQYPHLQHPYQQHPQHQHPQQHHQLPAQVLRKHSLPHLSLGALPNPPDSQPGTHPPPHQAGAPGPLGGLYGRGAGGRASAAYDNGLPAVQGSLAPAVRSFSFRAASRA